MAKLFYVEIEDNDEKKRLWRTAGESSLYGDNDGDVRVFAKASDCAGWLESHLDSFASMDTWNKVRYRKVKTGHYEVISGSYKTFWTVKGTSKSQDELFDLYQDKPKETNYSQTKTNSNFMPKGQNNGNGIKFTQVPYKKQTNQNGKVVGNPYQLKSANGAMYQAVPEGMVTLPAQHFIVGRKYLKMGTPNQITYVMGYSNTGSKTQGRNGKPHERRVWYVARLLFRGGRPNVALYRYLGYDWYTAKEVFNTLPYEGGFYLDNNQKWQKYRNASMTSAQIMQKKVAKGEYYKKLKDFAYKHGFRA